MKILTRVLVGAMLTAILGFGALTFSPATTTAQTELGPITSAIIERGELICGVNQTLAGFGVVNDAGEFSGFDVDFCRAVAAAVLGDSEAVAYRPLVASERQAAMQSGEIDLMVRNTTWTLSRDVTWGAIFGPTTFYDGQGVGTRADLGVTTIAELDGSAMCVQTGTTTELNITDFIEANGLDIEIQVYPDNPSTIEAFFSGACESWTTDKSGIAAIHATSDDPSQYIILGETLSKEPLGPLSPQSDPQFAEIMHWVHYGMVNAEEFGINSGNVMDFLDSEDAGIQRLLGQNNNDSGNFLGIPNDFMVAVISQVGNYGEVYERNLVPLGLTREGSPNASWTEGGLIYAPPFR
ncbi:MAG: amino acid ABC transporter substrate-binding protein [Chloroflexota bacterium]